MSIEYSTENKEQYLLIRSHGKSANLDVVSNYSREIAECCKKQGYSNMLVDERDREYLLEEVLDLYKIANFFRTLDISDLRIAIICQEKYLEQVRFLEITAQNRGMNIKFFLDTDSAERWLL